MPIPVTRPAPGSGSGYTSCPARGDSSKNGLPGSSRASTLALSVSTRSRSRKTYRSLAPIFPFPLAFHLSNTAGPPPSLAFALRLLILSISLSILSLFVWASGDEARTVVGSGRGVTSGGGGWGISVRCRGTKHRRRVLEPGEGLRRGRMGIASSLVAALV